MTTNYELERDSSALATKIELLTADLAACRQERDELRRRWERLHAEAYQLERERDALREQISVLETVRDNLRNSRDLVRTERDAAEARERALAIRVGERANELENVLVINLGFIVRKEIEGEVRWLRALIAAPAQTKAPKE